MNRVIGLLGLIDEGKGGGFDSNAASTPQRYQLTNWSSQSKFVCVN